MAGEEKLSDHCMFYAMMNTDVINCWDIHKEDAMKRDGNQMKMRQCMQSMALAFIKPWEEMFPSSNVSRQLRILIFSICDITNLPYDYRPCSVPLCIHLHWADVHFMDT